MDTLDKSLEEDLKAFKVLTPKRKASVILSDYKNSYYNANKVAKAKTVEEKDMYSFHKMRFYLKAQRELRLLDNSEMTVYLSTIQSAIDKDMSSRLNFGKYLEKSELYNSAIFMLREHEVNGEVCPPAIEIDNSAREQLDNIVMSLDKMKSVALESNNLGM